MQHMTIEYHGMTIIVQAPAEDEQQQFRLIFPGDRWLLMSQHPDDTKTVATYNDNISYSTGTVWAIDEQSQGPDWINAEQLQVLGEIVLRKTQQKAAA
ncbi:MAG: hypothetical protein KGO82_00930 [Bacteroidota bacterium]|nr:hypothetical protein [Bacteroidota bacterium]